LKTPAKRRLELAAGEARVSRARILTPLVTLSAAAVVTTSVFVALRLGNKLWIQSRGEAEFVMKPSAVLWLLIAFPIGLAVACLTWDRISRVLLGPAPTRFSAEYTWASVPSPTWFRVAMRAILAVFLLIGVMNIRKHARLTAVGIRDQRALAWQEQIYPYRMATTIELSHHWLTGSRWSRGGPSPQRVLFVYLSDGKRWSPADSELSEDGALNAGVAARIARHTGLSVRYPDTVVDARTNKARPRGLLGEVLFSGLVLVLLLLGLRARQKKNLR
jgi:hypothetical protein